MLVNEQRQTDRLSKYCKSTQRYQLPAFVDQFSGNESDDFQEDLREAMEYGLCHSAWTTIYNLGRTAEGKIKSIVEGSQSMVHGNTGKRNIDKDKEKAYNEIIETLGNLQENRSMPFATLIVKDVAGHSSLRDDNDYVFLPPSFSKRQCYLEICCRSGWKPAWTDKGKCKFKPIHEWQPRDGFVLTGEQANLQENEGFAPTEEAQEYYNRMTPETKRRLT